LPPALAGGKGNEYQIGISQKECNFAKAKLHYGYFIPLAKAGGNSNLKYN